MAVNFDFEERLGAGYFGEVWLATDTGLNARRAVKLISPNRVLNPGNFFHEAQMLKSVEHANVVRVEETGTIDDQRIYVAMEYLRKGSLEDEAKGSYVDLTRAKRLMIDVLSFIAILSPLTYWWVTMVRANCPISGSPYLQA
jgi:serine/threonine protein kinase